MSVFEMLLPAGRRRAEDAIRWGTSAPTYRVLVDHPDVEPLVRYDLDQAMDDFDRLRRQYPGVPVRVVPGTEDGAA